MGWRMLADLTGFVGLGGDGGSNGGEVISEVVFIPLEPSNRLIILTAELR